jgi:hypothetical protein
MSSRIGIEWSQINMKSVKEPVEMFKLEKDERIVKVVSNDGTYDVLVNGTLVFSSYSYDTAHDVAMQEFDPEF